MSGESATSSNPPSADRSRQLAASARRNWTWWVAQVFCRLVFTTWLRYRARGLENVPKVGGGLVLANHSSFLDPLLIGLPLQRPVSFLARDSLFRVPVVGWILRNTFVMPINREAASTAGVREMVSRIDAGYLVGIFPEGTRSEDGTVGAFKPGFTAVLRRTTDPVYPVGIAGADKALGRRHWVMRPSRVCVVFGEPIPRHVLEPLMQRGRETELLELMRQRVMDAQADANAWLAGESLPKKAQA